MKTRRHALSDAQWQRLSPLFGKVPSPRRPGRPARDNRMMLDGCLWVLRTGAPWRDLPRRFGPWQTVYHRYHRWRTDGTWERIVAQLPELHDLAEEPAAEAVRPAAEPAHENHPAAAGADAGTAA